MKSLKFKVQVTPKQSAEIQRAIFEKGGSWANGDAYVKHQAYHFLVIDYGYLTYCVTEYDFYEHNGDVKQVFAREALALISEGTAIKPRPCPPTLEEVFILMFTPEPRKTK